MDTGGAYITSVTIDWHEVCDSGVYPFNVPAISNTTRLDFAQPLTLFCGENGTGKSTLLEAISIAWGLNPEGGSKNYRFSVQDTHSELYRYITLQRAIYKPKDSFFVRSDTMFNLISEMDELGDDGRYYGGRSLHRRSHGEGILTLVSQRFRGSGFYVLDEPETGLSQSGQMALLGEILRLANGGAQFIIATHSPILLAAPQACIYQFDEGVSQVGVEETLEWIMLERFFRDPEGAMSAFLDD